MTEQNHADISGLFSDALRQFGKASGDGTLEYIGMQLKSRQTAECRIYRKFPRETDAGFSGFRSPLHERLYRSFADVLQGVQMCDSSERAVDGGIRERALIQIPMNADYDKVLSAVRDSQVIPEPFRRRIAEQIQRMHRAVGAAFSPLFQIGAETAGSDGSLCGMKYYLTLRNDYSVRPVLTEPLFRTLEEVHQVPDCGGMYPMLKRIAEQQYFPSFIGMNDEGGQTECKLYYQSELFGSKIRQQFSAQNAAIASAICPEVLDSEILAFAEAHSLWAEGIAVSFHEPERIRFYWREL
ncbi:MAG: hypothetical protein IKI58_10965 [Oscillospiraceae bacterium]|nr:hypothetical protein [Oscillospiraceae bacterium]